MEIKVITDITTEPVTLAQARQWVNFDDTSDDEDARITSLVTSARELIEKECNVTMAQKVLQAYYHKDEIDQDRRFPLPYGPHKSIDEFVKVDIEGNETTLVENTGYYKQGNQFFEISLATRVSTWGGVETINDYKIQYTAGYGISDYTEDLPDVFKTAILEQVLLWYRRDYSNPQGMLSNIIREMVLPFSKNPWI